MKKQLVELTKSDIPDGYSIRIELITNNVPNPVKIIQPTDGYSPVQIGTGYRLKWNTGGRENPCSGFYVNLWENDIIVVEKENRGRLNWLSYLLKYDCSYKWQVIPYNENGEAKNCPIWRFETQKSVMPEPPISTIDTIVTNENEIIVPITVTNFNNIGCCDLCVIYDKETVKCTKIEMAEGIEGSFLANPANRDGAKFGWYIPDYFGEPLSLPDGAIFANLTFQKIKAGKSDLTFNMNNNLNCFWGTIKMLELPDTQANYNNGSLTFE